MFVLNLKMLEKYDLEGRLDMLCCCVDWCWWNWVYQHIWTCWCICCGRPEIAGLWSPRSYQTMW